MYIGVSIDPVRRWKQHTSPNSKKNSAIKDAIQSYGKDNFTMSIWDFDQDDIIDKLEVEAIKSFDTQVPNGYNFTLGGDGASYRVWDDEWNKLLGTVPDVDLGKILGCHASTIATRRKGLNIPTYLDSISIDWTLWDHLLGKEKDSTLAKKANISPSTVGMRRQSFGIEPFTKPSKRHKYPKELIADLGKFTDVELSKRYNIPSGSISRKRASLGIKRREGYVGHKKRVWTEEEEILLKDSNISVGEAKILVNASASLVQRYRKEHQVGRFTGRNKNGDLHHVQLEGQFLEDLLDESLSNKFLGEKYNLKPASIWSRRCSDKFLEIKNGESDK